MGIFDQLFRRPSVPATEPTTVAKGDDTAGSIGPRLARAGGVLEQDLWLFLGRGVKKVLPAGSRLPAQGRIILTNDQDHPERLIVLMLTGPSGQAPPKSLLLPTVLLDDLPADWRLEMRASLDIQVDRDGALSLRAQDLINNGRVVVRTSPPAVQSDAPWEVDGLRPNCLEWEQWMADRYEAILGDRFEVMETLTSGGFGVIYVVLDRKSPPPKRIHLLKTLRDDLAADAAARESFASELTVWQRLGRHPNIVGLDQVHEIGGRLFAAMEWLVHKDVSYTATTLSAYLRNGQAADAAARWALDFCAGMEHARSCGMRAHLDIKPDNLLIDHHSGQLKIADFGLAVVDEKLVGRTAAALPGDAEAPDQLEAQRSSVVRGERGLVCGTPGYMAPEILDGRIAWERSDVYSFGVVLWQMTMNTISLPYVWPSRGRLYERLSELSRQQKSGVFPSVPGPLRPVVARCLAAEPGERFAGFKELADAIRSHIASG